MRLKVNTISTTQIAAILHTLHLCSTIKATWTTISSNNMATVSNLAMEIMPTKAIISRVVIPLSSNTASLVLLAAQVAQLMGSEASAPPSSEVLAVLFLVTRWAEAR